MRRSLVIGLAVALVGGCADSERAPTQRSGEPQTARTCYERVQLGLQGGLRDLNDQNRLLFGDPELNRQRANSAVAGRIWNAGAVTTLLPPARFAGSNEEIYINALDMNESGDVVGVLVRYGADGNSTELIGLLWRGGVVVAEELFTVGYESEFVPQLAKINASGDVIVAIYDPTVDPAVGSQKTGVLVRDGVSRLLPFAPTDLNDDGVVVGLATTTSGTSPVMDRPDGSFLTLSNNPGLPGVRYSIFDRVWVMPNGDAALQWLDDEYRERAFHWRAGTLTPISDFGRQANVMGVGPNNTIIGEILNGDTQRAGYRYKDGVLEVLSTAGGGSAATAININGLTAGLAYSADPEGWPSAAYWDGNTFTLLPFDEPLRFGLWTKRVNAAGWIAAEHRGGLEQRKPVLWKPTACDGEPPPGNDAGTPPGNDPGAPPTQPPPEDPGE